MCDMYGHGWWDDLKGRAVCDYMHKNSHREFTIDPAEVYAERGALPVGRASLDPHTQRPLPIQARLRYIGYGLDPVDGRVIWQPNLYSLIGADGAPVIEHAGRIRASWDYEIPTIDKMCEFFDAHFGKRDDLMNWLERGPLLLAAGARRQFLETKAKGAWGLPLRAAWFEAPELIDAFRVHPNEYWEASRHENRRDVAARVLETSKGE